MILKLKMHLQHQEGSMTKKIILFAAVGGLALVASAFDAALLGARRCRRRNRPWRN
jgi:hypothetical protein